MRKLNTFFRRLRQEKLGAALVEVAVPLWIAGTLAAAALITRSTGLRQTGQRRSLGSATRWGSRNAACHSVVMVRVVRAVDVPRIERQLRDAGYLPADNAA